MTLHSNGCTLWDWPSVLDGTNPVPPQPPPQPSSPATGRPTGGSRERFSGTTVHLQKHTLCVPHQMLRDCHELSVHPPAPQPTPFPPSPWFPVTHHGAHIWYVSKSVQGLKFLIQFLEQLHVSFPGVHDFLQWQGFSLWYRQPIMEMHPPLRPPPTLINVLVSWWLTSRPGLKQIYSPLHIYKWLPK